jgi:hypothetical protein
MYEAAGMVASMLAEVRLSTYATVFSSEGYEYVVDLLEAEPADLEELMTKVGMKKPERKRFERVLALNRDSAGGGGGGSGGGDTVDAAAAQLQAHAAAADAAKALEAQRVQLAEKAEALRRQESAVAKQAVSLQVEQAEAAAVRLKAEEEAASLALARQLHEDEVRRQQQQETALAGVEISVALTEHVLIQGHQVTGYNGLYRKVHEHQGLPVLQNDSGNYLYHHLSSDSWRLSDKPRHDEVTCNSWINAETDGGVPIGDKTWNTYVAAAKGFQERCYSTRVFATAAEAEGAAKRIEEERLGRINAELAAGVTIEGHQDAGYDGLYRKVHEHQGLPVLQNDSGSYLYHHLSTSTWRLSDKPRHDEDTCKSWINAETDGGVPIGDKTWNTYVLAAKGFQERCYSTRVFDG